VRPLVLISSLAPGGAEQVNVTLLTRLRREGMAVPLCTVTSRHDGPLAREVRNAGVQRLDLGARRLADPLALIRLIRLLRAESIDLLHAHGQDAAILGAAACRVWRVPLVITRHVLEEPGESRRERARARLTLRAFRQADVPVAVSFASAARLSRLSGRAMEDIRVLHNGIHVDAYSAPAPEPARQALRNELSLPPDARLVLLPAVMRGGKGHDTLLDAAPALADRVPRVHILLAGTGELESRLRAKAAGHDHMIHFLGHRTDMPELMAGCDLVVLPSMAEALPTVLMEAAAASRPVVATSVGGVPEVVEDGGTGLLVPPDDPVALAWAITALLMDRPRARAFGERARKVARNLFSLERQVERTVELWQETARGGRV
jgi:glycosyltransferase involved in cell wall biosynthesis